MVLDLKLCTKTCTTSSVNATHISWILWSHTLFGYDHYCFIIKVCNGCAFDLHVNFLEALITTIMIFSSWSSKQWHLFNLFLNRIMMWGFYFQIFRHQDFKSFRSLIECLIKVSKTIEGKFLILLSFDKINNF